MRQRKKTQNKENHNKINKRILTQHLHYTESLRIPTFPAAQIQQGSRSIQLKKVNSKKPTSRKSKCVSVKQAGVPVQPLKFKNLMKQFKELKLIEERFQTKSKQKSPKLNKSKQKSKKSSKKITQVNESCNDLTIKVQNTIEKLRKQKSYFKDEESQFLIFCKSETDRKKQYCLSPEIFSDNEQEINIREMRLYEKNFDQSHFIIRKNIDYFKGNIYDSMARKIQRAWREYRTHKLVHRYTNLCTENQIPNISGSSKELFDYLLHHEGQQDPKQEICTPKLDNFTFGKQQFEEISENRKSSFEQEEVEQIIENQLKQNGHVESYQSISEKDEFNSNKYIEYLDCDIYPVFQRNDQNNNQNDKQEFLKKVMQKLAEGRHQRHRSTVSDRCISYFSNDDSKSSRGIINHRRSSSVSDGLMLFQAKQKEKPILQQNLLAEKHQFYIKDESGNLLSEEQIDKKISELKKMMEETKVQKDQPTSPKLHQINVKDFVGESDSPSSKNEEQKNINDEAEFFEDFQLFDVGQKSERVTDLILQLLYQEFIDQITHGRNKKIFLKKGNHKPIKNISNKKMAFKTNQSEIKKFIEQLCDYVLNEEPHIFKNLEKPTGPTALEMLKYMHTQIGEDVSCSDDEDGSVIVIPNWIFDAFWKEKPDLIKLQTQEKVEDQTILLLRNLGKTFFHSCFDCLNQCLDYERNFSIFGRPFPWKKSPLFQYNKGLQETKKSVLNAQRRLYCICSTYCGIIIEKGDLPSLNASNSYIEKVQQDRLNRLLTSDIMESEHRWSFYDDEEMEILVQISNFIFGNLLLEIADQIQLIL